MTKTVAKKMIVITISGAPGAGKSAIASMVRSLMETSGLAVRCEFCPGIAAAVEIIQKLKPPIQIRTEQI